METERKTELRERMQKEGKDWIIEVGNAEQDIALIAEFDSKKQQEANTLSASVFHKSPHS